MKRLFYSKSLNVFFGPVAVGVLSAMAPLAAQAQQTGDITFDDNGTVHAQLQTARAARPPAPRVQVRRSDSDGENEAQEQPAARPSEPVQESRETRNSPRTVLRHSFSAGLIVAGGEASGTGGQGAGGGLSYTYEAPHGSLGVGVGVMSDSASRLQAQGVFRAHPGCTSRVDGLCYGMGGLFQYNDNSLGGQDMAALVNVAGIHIRPTVGSQFNVGVGGGAIIRDENQALGPSALASFRYANQAVQVEVAAGMVLEPHRADPDRRVNTQMVAQARVGVDFSRYLGATANVAVQADPSDPNDPVRAIAQAGIAIRLDPNRPPSRPVDDNDGAQAE